MKVIKAPNKVEVTGYGPSIFLAGSIEMGKAELWQDRIAKELDRYSGVILNPRRDDWDSSWEQKISNPQFHQQVTWELNALKRASIVAMYLQPGTMSPISLLELGIRAEQKPHNLILCCPDGFWRKGNVDIVAQRYGVKVHETFDSFLEAIQKRLEAVT